MKIFLKTLTIIFGLFAGIYGVNAAVIFFTQPSNIQQGQTVHVDAEYGSISIVLVKDLKSGGLGVLSSGAAGYVNVMSPEPNIYLNETQFKTAPSRNSYIYRHEFAHVLQKQLVASKVGGYPSYDNPLISYRYYFELLKLNQDFMNVMPKDNHDAHVSSIFSGLELSADCFSQLAEYVGKPMQYIGSEGCTPEQRYMSIALISGRWPTPLTPEEKIVAYERNEIRKAKQK